MPGTDQRRRKLPLPTVWFAPVMAPMHEFPRVGLHWDEDHRHAPLSGGERC